MNEREERSILYHQRKRRRHKIKLALAATIFIVLALILIGIYSVLNRQHSINYKESAKVNYIVNLLENEFYEKDYIDEGIDIISSLIKDINVEFSYNLELEEEVEYIYTYKILAETQVREKSKTNSLYETTEEILSKAEREGKSRKLVISEKINLDYNKYNNQINRLIESYRLANTVSELNLTVYLNIINKSTGEQINKENKVMSLKIPLTTKTVEVTVNESVKDSRGEIIIKESQNEDTEYILIIGILILVIGLITLGKLIKYKSDTRSAEKMYEDELRKILFDYKSYIQKINTEIDYKYYKIICVNTFNELMAMREDIQAPILMYTEKNDLITTFMIIKDDMLFTYVLGAKLIREQLIEESKRRKERKNEKNK